MENINDHLPEKEIITFEQLPEKVGFLIDSVKEIKKLLIEQAKEHEPNPDQWFDVSELCDYLPDKPVRVTIYEKVQKRLIPFRRSGKKLIFLKSEIDQWLKEGRQKTIKEIALEADEYSSKKRGLNHGK